MKKKAKLEEILENKRDNVNVIKEQLKQKNPSYARVYQRLKAKQVGQIPEIIGLTN
ncbi:MAG: hypothetical protein Q8894_02460 [Sweet potato little leaf phytoplasma]|nr:hypothetical protein [Candidatus Phytoplasma australasiaticum]MDV3204622.1 hypothetical protein [Sweet potato little leaf phytoplasma]MDV3181043.1 hypothetical protein [Candidatus Phytoplasma australasiaticum]MDV3183273.1 hypothetical protein [Candidatus Phytoplasma australasiaticum]MDV3185751.1 hypothetical protein [Candidatus Phytoplasma australasiaticum]